ncbi:MAG: hypothetical protein HY774_03350 [Acidobacteria bacterium]|nr:hypothetical protein [Acidobacteriota bacterium]
MFLILQRAFGFNLRSGWQARSPGWSLRNPGLTVIPNFSRPVGNRLRRLPTGREGERAVGPRVCTLGERAYAGVPGLKTRLFIKTSLSY